MAGTVNLRDVRLGLTLVIALVAAIVLAAPAAGWAGVTALRVTGEAAEPEVDADDVLSYVESNTLALFYHELGHALIDVLDLPVLGQEEAAADVLSVLMFDYIYVEEDAEQIARDAAISFLISAADEDSDPAIWDVHGLDLQRFYTLVCLHYGASPQRRDGFRVEMELPDDRAEGCVDERTLADESWGVYLDDVETGAAGSAKLSFRLETEPETEAQRAMVAILEAEVAEWNAFAGLPTPVAVVFDQCGEVNAFYVPDVKTIVMCAEYADYLDLQFRQ